MTIQVQIQILDHEDKQLQMLTYYSALPFFSFHTVSSPPAELTSTVEGFVLIFPDRSITLIRECQWLQVWWVSNGIIWISNHAKTDIIHAIGVCDSSYATHRSHVHVSYSHIVTVCTLVLKQDSPFLQEWLIRNGWAGMVDQLQACIYGPVGHLCKLHTNAQGPLCTVTGQWLLTVTCYIVVRH